MSSIRLRKLGSLLGLFAILMSVLAPAISQTLTAHHRAGEVHSSFCDMEHGDVAHSHGSPDHSLAQHLQACHYCSLLAHVPVLPGGAAPLPVALAVARASVDYAGHEVRTLSAYTAAQPRAPPAFS